MTEWSN